MGKVNRGVVMNVVVIWVRIREIVLLREILWFVCWFKCKEFERKKKYFRCWFCYKGLYFGKKCVIFIKE